MKQLLFLFLALFFFGCASEDNKSAGGNNNADASKSKKQLNISILLDLSDRISPKEHPSIPEHFQRDTAIIKLFAEYFKRDMAQRGTYMAKGKIKVFFSPQPPDPNINILASKLNIDLSKMDNKHKKEIYDTITKTFPSNAYKIYSTTISNNKWIGSDIWRFFKNDVKDYCIEKDTNYRNILVLFTDGYIYHQNSMDNIGNRYAYILPQLFTKYNLRNNPPWESIIEKNDFGLITKRNDLQNLEVLVLEVTPSESNINDEDIIKKIIYKWFNEMGIKRSVIYSSDLPEYTKQRIFDFLN
jgi:hypothetical protein